MIKKLTLGIFTAVLVLFSAEESVFAQYGMPQMPGTGNSALARPKRKLKKSRAPVLSPSLNLLPEIATSFEGQFLMRQLPQEQALKSYQQTGKTLDKLQQEITDKDNDIKTGIKSTGHRTQFMSYGSYYSFAGGRSRGR